MTGVDYRRRADAFLMATDENPPTDLKRWLVVWTDIDVHGTKWTGWAHFDESGRAVRRAADMSGKVIDLDGAA